MPAIFDDIDARPGSTTSFLRTIIGLYLRRLDGWVSIADLVSLMSDLGHPDARTRTAVVRLKQKELLLPMRRSSIGYRLNPGAEPMLERGDRRIFNVRQMQDGDKWCVVSFSIPESQRDLRHQLRRRLHWIGCGVVSPALWICPDYLMTEVEEIFEELQARSHATLFRTEAPSVSGSLQEAVSTWWDLNELRAAHLSFQATVASLRSGPGLSALEAFVSYVQLVDSWRILPYIDPGLPSSLLPADWPGKRSIDTFNDLSMRLASSAWDHVRTVTAS